ncbi:MAG: hypothetical protein KC496_08040 [Anaerolineae bacterium]|nr:hypothetical protein [Anaerolineae bacterium]
MYEHEAESRIRLAQEYIREKRYDEARDLLAYAYDARSQALLRKIEELQGYKPVQYHHEQQVIIIQSGKQSSCLTGTATVALLLLSVLLCFAIFWYLVASGIAIAFFAAVGEIVRGLPQ